MKNKEESLITNFTLGEVTQHIISHMPKGDYISPEERYISTEALAKIMKVSVQQICNMKTLGMGEYAAYGENLWDWVLALEWRKKIYGKVTGENRKNAKKKK
jgi:hypothetical protein